MRANFILYDNICYKTYLNVYDIKYPILICSRECVMACEYIV